MPTAAEALALAKSYHLAGQLRDDEELCRSIVRADPENAEEFCLLGAACGGLGKTDDAIASLVHAVRL